MYNLKEVQSWKMFKFEKYSNFENISIKNIWNFQKNINLINVQIWKIFTLKTVQILNLFKIKIFKSKNI
jgi:hypothetical protein